jgi:hypothetical protein
VEQSFLKEVFKLMEKRWRACTWGGVRVALRKFFANSAENFV